MTAAVRLLTISLLAVCAVAGLWAVRTAWVHYRAVLHDFDPAPPSHWLAHPEQVRIDGLRGVAFRSANGNRIAGWYVPSRNRAAVIVTHGTNSDRSSMLDEIEILAAAGFGVLAFDWPGDGESEGHVQWGEAEHLAFAAAIDWLSAQPDVDPTRVGAFGFSMGGYLTIQVAAQDPRLRAITVAAAPTSFQEYTRQAHARRGWLSSIPAEWGIRRVGMVHESAPPIDRIASIAPRPLLLLGGTEDRTIPPAMVSRLFDRAAYPKEQWLVRGASHGHYRQAQPIDYPRRIVKFFEISLLPV